MLYIELNFTELNAVCRLKSRLQNHRPCYNHKILEKQAKFEGKK